MRGASIMAVAAAGSRIGIKKNSFSPFRCLNYQFIIESDRIDSNILLNKKN